MSYNLEDNVGLFLPKIATFDIQNLQEGKDISPALKELLVLLYRDISRMSSAVNLKVSGYLSQQEFINGKLLFNQIFIPNSQGRQVYTMTVDCGALPDTTIKAIPHNIRVINATQWICSGGFATNQIALTGIPIPNASATTARIIEVSVDAVNVYITTSSDMTAFTQSYVTLEYVKQ